MIYVALLRGINVGGNNKVPMSELKAVFEAAGMSDVRTYINSGNVVFSAKRRNGAVLAEVLESAIAAHFGFGVSVLVRDLEQIRSIAASLPDGWANNDTMKCDVVFLWDEIDSPAVLEQLSFRAEIEDVFYTPGAIVHRIDRTNATKSGLPRVVGTPIYQQMTVRNCNTARKLLELMEASESD